MFQNIDWKKMLTEKAILFVVVFAACLLALWVYFKSKNKASNKVTSADKPMPIATTAAAAAAPSSYHGMPRMNYSEAPGE